MAILPKKDNSREKPKTEDNNSRDKQKNRNIITSHKFINLRLEMPVLVI